jgi:hypothetical protein
MIKIIQRGEKKLGHNYNINFLHNLGNYNKLDEWENHSLFDADAIVMYYH